jgi:hypothetical protein
MFLSTALQRKKLSPALGIKKKQTMENQAESKDIFTVFKVV